MATRKLSPMSLAAMALIANIDPFTLPAKRVRPPPAPRQYDTQLQTEVAQHNAAVAKRKAEKAARKLKAKISGQRRG